MTKETTKSWWTEADICKALCLRTKSIRAYEFVRDHYKIPLPCLRTLQGWMRNIRYEPGLLHPVFNLLECEFVDADPKKRQCAIVFDEMNIEASIAYDAGADRVYGPHKNLLVVFLRGLDSAWKQPIYYGFDDKLDPLSIFSIITEVHRVGLNVVAMVCDNEGGNRGIWTKLEVTYEKPHFPNPVTGESVFCISDPPHLIKLMRNNIMDYGLKLKDGTEIRKGDFEDLLKIDSAEYKSCHKLTRRHITAIQSDRQNVRMAFQTLSASVSQGFKSYLHGRTKQAEFIRLANDAFDVLNSRNPNHFNLYKCSFGTYLHNQVEVLNQFYDELDTLRVMCRRQIKHYPFQKGLLMTINSVKQLYNSQVEAMGIQHINLNRLNQDVAENAFCIIRGLGIFKQNPTCVDAKYRLRMLCVGWHLLSPSKYANVDDDSDEDVFAKRILPLLDHSFAPAPPISQQVENSLQEIEEFNQELSEENFSTVFHSMGNSDKAEFGGQEYISGYIIRKLKAKYPDLDLEVPFGESRIGWTFGRSLGNLSIPSLNLVNLIRKWEKYFELYHAKDPSSNFKYKINRNYGVVDGIATRIYQNFPEIPKALIKYFVKVRTCSRIKDLNIKLNQWRASKRNARKLGQFAQSSIPGVNFKEESEEDGEDF